MLFVFPTCFVLSSCLLLVSFEVGKGTTFRERKIEGNDDDDNNNAADDNDDNDAEDDDDDNENAADEAAEEEDVEDDDILDGRCRRSR